VTADQMLGASHDYITNILGPKGPKTKMLRALNSHRLLLPICL